MGDRRASTSSDLSEGAEEEDHIRVICRVRPPQIREGRSSALGLRTCVTVGETRKTVTLKQASGPKVFTFDHAVGDDASQESVFQLAGKPATKACILGYNGTVFCYGQTGSGKTYTMFGPNVDACGSDDEHRGLVPRVLEYLFAHVAREERRNGGAITYLCRCSFYEIFNERVFDLLDSDSGCSVGGLQTREDMKKGVYVEGLTEEAVDSPYQAHQVLTRGYRNRHVGETAMNRESSRSHAVFTVVLESREVDTVDGITRARCASFNLVDLAGSERQGQTGATGERLKEASSINKSLSALGNVINALVSGRTRYVPYRDSRLTFLLRDSLGGNAKTFLVACTSPNDENFAETLSTLKFAQRAKMIKNKAVVNENTSGTVEALQKQLRTLRQELLAARAVVQASGAALPPPSNDEIPGASATLAALRRTEELLREALERNLHMEQARDLAEKMAGNVQATVDRLEQSLLHERMVRKMKESYISRHLKKAADKGRAESKTVEEDLRLEIETLRKEMSQVPVEAIKWRAAAENAQAQLDALLDEKEGLGMWVDDREKTFATALEERLRATMVEKAELEARVFGGTAGGEGEPGKGQKRLSDGGMNRLREAEMSTVRLEDELTAATRQAEDCEAELAEVRARAAQAVSAQSQIQVQLTHAERRLEALEGENKVLKADRDFNMALLQERIEDTQSQAQAAKQDVEAQLAAACKDNAILLQRLKKTAEEAENLGALHEAAEKQVQTLRDEIEADLRPRLLRLEAELEEREKDLADSQERVALKTAEMEAAATQAQQAATAAAAMHGEELQGLRVALDEEIGRAQALRAEKDEGALQLANLQEEHDTLTQLLEFTRGQNAEMEQGMGTIQARLEALEKEKARTEGDLEDARAHVLELECRLDKAGGDAAEERRTLRALEGVHHALAQERDQLAEVAESLREEVKCAKAAHEQAKKEAARTAQVLTDLGEQVGRLRADLAEAQAKEQAARSEAEGLGQEREDLLQRAHEAEDSQAEMGEEMMAYLDEITMLKTRLQEGERVHADRTRELEAAWKAAEKESGARAARVAVLANEVQRMQERLDQQQAADYDAKAMMQAELTRQLQEAEWKHTKAMADLQQELAEAAARGAEAARFKAALGSSQSQVEALRESLVESKAALEAASVKGNAAEERSRSLAHQLGEALARESDAGNWREEKARWELEMARAREMEKEAYERCETAEQEKASLGKSVEALEAEVEELKSVNVRLVGHANSRQKIQLHSKLKEELTELSRKYKMLEEENYSLKVMMGPTEGGNGDTKGGSLSLRRKGKSTPAAPVDAAEPAALSNVTNTSGRRPTRRTVTKKKGMGLEALAAEGPEATET